MHLLIRADGNAIIGAGHVIRSMALATALRHKGRSIRFLTRGDGLGSRMRDARFDVHEIGADAAMHQDLEATLSLLEQHRPAGLILDGYAFDQQYQRAVVEAGHFLVCIDDEARFHQHAHVVVNHNVYAREADYSREAYTRLLLGPGYALLREEFASVTAARCAETVLRILITMGGSDPQNATMKAIRAVDMLNRDVDVDVIIGPANRCHQEVRRFTGRGFARFYMHLDPPEFHAVLASADLAIAAAGGTSLEMMCLGLPSVKLALSENQEPVGRELARRGLCRYAGRVEDVDEGQLAQAVVDLAGDYEARRRMSASGRALVDGRGANRVAEALA